MKTIAFVIAAVGMISLTTAPSTVHFYDTALGGINTFVGTMWTAVALFAAIASLVIAAWRPSFSDENFWNMLAAFGAVFGIGLAHLYALVGQEVTFVMSMLVTLGIAAIAKRFLEISLSRSIPALGVMFATYDIAVVHNTGGSSSFLESLAVFALGLIVGSTVLFYRRPQHDPLLIEGRDY